MRSVDADADAGRSDLVTGAGRPPHGRRGRAPGRQVLHPPPRPARRWAAPAVLGVALVSGTTLRLVNLDALGFNSDEAVYAGQAASLAGNPLFVDQFPVFRAHPMLIHTILSPVYATGQHDVAGRVVVAFIGVLTVVLVWEIGRRLYGSLTGAVAALVIAVMPYHVLVTRQVLLDGPMVFFSTLTLYLLVLFMRARRTVVFLAAAGAMGLTMLAKESSVVLLGSVYAFLALTPQVRRPWRLGLSGLAVVVLVFATYPVSQRLAGAAETGKGYLTYQLLRRPNHEWPFYFQVAAPAIGLLVIAASALAVLTARRAWTWRETLLTCWILVPVAFFQLWTVKGFQYLLPVAPAVALLAARGLTGPWPSRRGPAAWRPGVRLVAGAVVVLSVALPSWRGVNSSAATTFLAGTGGVPGGREVGTWLAENTPAGSVMLTVGPSMSNIIKYYSHRGSFGLSVSPNPLRRNPAYEPVVNPDRALRDNEMNYVVWDAYSANRSPFFSDSLLELARRYNGRVVYTYSVTRDDRGDEPVDVPVIVVYEVRP